MQHAWLRRHAALVVAEKHKVGDARAACHFPSSAATASAASEDMAGSQALSQTVVIPDLPVSGAQRPCGPVHHATTFDNLGDPFASQPTSGTFTNGGPGPCASGFVRAGSGLFADRAASRSSSAGMAPLLSAAPAMRITEAKIDRSGSRNYVTKFVVKRPSTSAADSRSNAGLADGGTFGSAVFSGGVSTTHDEASTPSSSAASVPRQGFL
jgi:hypothetical protein